MRQIIKFKLYENTDSGKVHLHQLRRQRDGKIRSDEDSICTLHDRTDDHSKLWISEVFSNKDVLIKLLPELAKRNLEHILCERCLMKILEE